MDSDVLELAAMIYGEAGSTDTDTMLRVGSTAVNRMASGRSGEFGETLPDVLHRPNAYYSVQNMNDPYKWAMTGKFPNQEEETRYKQALQIAYGLKTGNISPKEGMFFFKPQEEKKMRKAGKKVFNFDLVKSSGKDDVYNYYSY